jgi:hypothetical protein
LSPESSALSLFIAQCRNHLKQKLFKKLDTVLNNFYKITLL